MSMPILSPLTIDLNTVSLRAKINELRVAAGENPIRNNDFLARVRDEIDDLGALRNFRSANSDHPLAREQEIDGYELTKDQALLVGMRESKVVRRQVVKWLNTLTEQVAAPQPIQPPAVPMLESVAAIQYIMGLTPGVNPVMLQATLLNHLGEVNGFDVEPFRRILPPHEGPTCNLNATGVGELLGVSAREANRMLENAGLQYRDGRGDWQFTEYGMEYGEARAYKNGSRSGYQLLWSEDVVSVFDKIKRLHA